MDGRAFIAVRTKDGRCLNDEWHFKGAAREVYSYLKLLAKNHGGFVFCSVADIVRHTKKFHRSGEPFSKRQCERILRMFRELGVLGKYCKRVIRGRTYHGWQFAEHRFWTKHAEDVCEFRLWESYEAKHRKYMDNVKSTEQNGGAYGGDYGGACDGDSPENGGAYGGAYGGAANAENA